jgi:hypothetical protein
MTRAAVASGESEIHRIRPGHWLGLGFVFIVFAEFRRAVAAEQRYEELKRNSTAALVRAGIARPDVPRRVFEELYSTPCRSQAPHETARIHHQSGGQAIRGGSRHVAIPS